MTDDAIVERLIRIEVLTQTNYDLLIKQVADQEQRLRAIERWRYALPASLIIAATSIVVVVTNALGR